MCSQHQYALSTPSPVMGQWWACLSLGREEFREFQVHRSPRGFRSLSLALTSLRDPQEIRPCLCQGTAATPTSGAGSLALCRTLARTTSSDGYPPHYSPITPHSTPESCPASGPNFPPELRVLGPNPRSLCFSFPSSPRGLPVPDSGPAQIRRAPSKQPQSPPQGPWVAGWGPRGCSPAGPSEDPPLSRCLPHGPAEPLPAFQASHSLLHLPPRSSRPSPSLFPPTAGRV